MIIIEIQEKILFRKWKSIVKVNLLIQVFLQFVE